MILSLMNLMLCVLRFRRATLVAARLVVAGLTVGVVSCGSMSPGPTASREILISVKDQKLALIEHGKPVAVYPVSTSRFCLGDTPGSNGTPLGKMKVAQKIGDGAPMGAVFKNRRPTGEVLPPNAPGRDPIVTRILRLTGQESRNARTFARNIYIHGTPEESTIGRPASFGCVRMRSQDVVDLFSRVPAGIDVNIIQDRLPRPARALARQQTTSMPEPLPAHHVVPVPKPAFGRPKAQLAAASTFGPPVP